MMRPIFERVVMATDLSPAWDQIVARGGHPVPVILEFLRTSDISLIVLGTQGKGFIAEIFLGSVAHNISRFAPCPIILIPPADRDSRVLERFRFSVFGK